MTSPALRNERLRRLRASGSRVFPKSAAWSAGAIVAVSLLLASSSFAAYSVAARISVDSDTVTLADLVPGAPSEWSRVALGRGPRPGGERTLDRAWVLQRARQVDAEGSMDVPEEVVLTRPGQEVDRDDLVRRVKSALAQRLNPRDGVRVVGVGLPGQVPAGSLDLVVRLPDGPIRSPATVWVDVLCGGERRARAWVRVEVYRGRPVVRTTRDLDRGAVVAAEDVEVSSGDPPWGALSDPSQAVGKVLVHRLRAGATLTTRDVDVLPLVDRGDMVRLVARVGGVRATTLGKALDKAGVGESLRVENLVSGRTVTGVLRDGGVVDVAAGLGR